MRQLLALPTAVHAAAANRCPAGGALSTKGNATTVVLTRMVGKIATRDVVPDASINHG